MLKVLLAKEFSLLNILNLFLFHPDPISKSACRTVALQMLKLRHPAVTAYAVDQGFLLSLVVQVRQKLHAVQAVMNKRSLQSTVEDALANLVDDIYFLNDLVCLDNCEVAQAAVDIMFRYFLLPVIFGSFAAERPLKWHISVYLSLFFIVHLFSVCANQKVLRQCLVIISRLHVSIEVSQLYTADIYDFSPKAEPIVFESEPGEMVVNTACEALKGWIQSRDDIMVYLMLSLIQVVLRHSAIDEELRREFESLVFTESFAQQIICTFEVGPLFSLSTYELIANTLVLLKEKQSEIFTESTALLLKEKLQWHTDFIRSQADLLPSSYARAFIDTKQSIQSVNLARAVSLTNLARRLTNLYSTSLPLDELRLVSSEELARGHPQLLYIQWTMAFYLGLSSIEPFFPEFLNENKWKVGAPVRLDSVTSYFCVIQGVRSAIVDSDTDIVVVEVDSKTKRKAEVKQIIPFREVRVRIHSTKERILIIGFNSGAIEVKMERSEQAAILACHISERAESALDIEVSIIKATLVTFCDSLG